MKTTVINVRGKRREELEGDPNFVYVGRTVPRTEWKNLGWGNPFKEGQDPGRAMKDLMPFVRAAEQSLSIAIEGALTAEKAVEFYGHYVKALWILFPEWRERAGALRGKKLGCWCCDWPGEGEPSAPCHAVVLARLVDSLGGEA